MVKDKALIIIQARMSSERLPGKVMREIGGKPMIGILLDRLSESGLDIILATSSLPADDELVNYVKSRDIDVFRGSENNVLERFYLASKTKNRSIIVRITGDNPLIDGKLLKEKVIEYASLDNPNVYFSAGRSKTYPVGISFEIFSQSMLDEAYSNSTLPGQFEHVTPYMHQNVSKKVCIIPVKYRKNRYHYRLTVDTEEDFKLMSELILKYNCDKKSIDQIIEVLDKNPELSKINSFIHQRKWDE